MSTQTNKTEGDISPSVLEVQDLLLHRPSWYGTLGPAGSDVPECFNADEWVEVQIPFVGTYESQVSYAADSMAELAVDEEEYEQRQIEFVKESDSWKEFLATLDDDDVELAKAHKTQLQIGIEGDLNQYLKEYISYVEDKLQEAIGERFNYHMILSEMVSPREYNFTTDRLYAYMHKSDWEKLNVQKVFKTDLYKDWAYYLYTGRDGYIPFYDKEHFFDEENIVHISEGIIAYHLARSYNESQDEYEQIKSLYYVSSMLIDGFYLDSYGMEATNNYEFYLYRHANPDEWDSR